VVAKAHSSGLIVVEQPGLFRPPCVATCRLAFPPMAGGWWSGFKVLTPECGYTISGARR